MRLLTTVVTTEDDRQKIAAAYYIIKVAYPNLDELRRDHRAHELELAPVVALERIAEEDGPVPYRWLDQALEALRRLEDRIEDETHLGFWVGDNGVPTWPLRQAAAEPPFVILDAVKLAEHLVEVRKVQFNEVQEALAVVRRGMDLIDAVPPSPPREKP